MITNFKAIELRWHFRKVLPTSITKTLLLLSILPFNTASKIETFLRLISFCLKICLFQPIFLFHPEQERNEYKILRSWGYLELNFWLFPSMNLWILLEEKGSTLEVMKAQKWTPHSPRLPCRPSAAGNFCKLPYNYSRPLTHLFQVLMLRLLSSLRNSVSDGATKVNVSSQNVDTCQTSSFSNCVRSR